MTAGVRLCQVEQVPCNILNILLKHLDWVMKTFVIALMHQGKVVRVWAPDWSGRLYLQTTQRGNPARKGVCWQMASAWLACLFICYCRSSQPLCFYFVFVFSVIFHFHSQPFFCVCFCANIFCCWSLSIYRLKKISMVDIFAMKPPKLFLFDIQLTLIHTGDN